MTGIDRENQFVLDLVQAMIGAVSSNFRRVSLEPTDDGVRLQFVLHEESVQDREEIDDIVFELEALQNASVAVDLEVLVNVQALSDVPPLRRLVFTRRE